VRELFVSAHCLPFLPYGECLLMESAACEGTV
jgi:hypothetical protein